VALPSILALAALTLALRPDARAQAGAVERAVFASAVDRSGNPVEGLGPEAFVVRENGVRREILRVSRAVEPIDVTLMIDNSTAAADEVPFYRSTLPKFIAALAPENPVAIVGLADRPTILVPSTTEVRRLTGRIEGLFAMPGSGMTLLDAMFEVSEGLRKRTSARAAIVAVVTDGTEFTNRFSKEVVEALQRARASAHLITIGQFVDDVEHAERERAFFIAQAPKATGGQHLSLLAPHALGVQLDRVARDLTSQYKVVYARPNSLIPPDTIEVTSGREDLTVRGTPDRSQKGA
jgi:VWFA-related protein